MIPFRAASENDRNLIQNKIHSSFPIIQSVINQTQQGKIYLDDHGDFWVLHKAGFSELFLLSNNADGWARFILTCPDVPQYFHLYDPNATVVEALRTVSHQITIRERERVQLVYQPTNTVDSPPLDAGYHVEEITEDNFAALHVFKLCLDTKFWDGKNEFIKKALGVVVKDQNNNPASICYAAAVADRLAEIDVATLDMHRGKGLAKAAVKYFIHLCESHSIVPNWDCFKENIFSLKIAQSLGYKESKSYTLFSLYLK